MRPFDHLSLVPPSDRPWGVNFGGGTNSTALIVELHARGYRPDWIVFADTGGEKPETYAALDRLQAWLAERAWPLVQRVRWERIKALADGSLSETLEEYCHRLGYMPSAAYGYGGCATKFKRQPAERWRKEHGFWRTVYALGFDAGETKRVNRRKCESGEGIHEEPWYPLYAWGMTRAACEATIGRAGLPPVPKSACFFCPYTKAHEWADLARQHPGLYQRALAIEAQALAAGNAKSGLRRSQGFLRDLPLAAPPRQEEQEERGTGIACDCFEASSG